MSEGKIMGFLAMGQNPAVGGQNAGYQRKALAKLDWMVVKDLYETETATFWKDSPEVQSGDLKPEAIPTEVFLLPAAATAEMDGTYTNTQRLLQWHERPARPAAISGSLTTLACGSKSSTPTANCRGISRSSR